MKSILIVDDDSINCLLAKHALAQDYRALAVKSGMDEFDALRAITINAAEHIGAADRVGSIEVGKDADLVLMDGTWDAVASTVKTVLVDGKVVVG